MPLLTFQINGTEKISRNLMMLSGRINAMPDFFSDAIDIVEDFNKKSFREGGKPKAWAALAASTVAARKKRTGYYKRSPSGRTGTLHWTGRLENDNKRTIGNKSGKFEKLAPYAPFHQYGGPNLPQRKVLTLDAATAADITRTLQIKLQRDIGALGLHGVL